VYAPDPDSRSGVSQASATGQRARHIVVAEDNDDMRTLIAERLRREGYEVIEARDGREMLDLLGGQPAREGTGPPIDLVISDVRMPGLGGLAALAGLCARDWAPPFIVITAFGDRETHAEAHRLGACAVFDKPFDFDDLCTVVVNRLRA
jgi:DNA-binding response OmpR family regulator